MKKYFSKIAAIMAVAALFLMTGCTEDTSVNYSDSVIKVVGTLHGVVTDAANNARMEGVTVTVVQKDKIFTTTTDALGYYIVKSLYSGSYVATFAVNGYALTKAEGYIPTEAEVYDSKADINQVEVLDIDLFALTAGLTGKIYKVIDNGNIVAASGVTVIADFDHFDLSPDEYTTTTNASGVYSFTNLPSAPMVSIRTLSYNDGTYSFDPTMSSAELNPGITTNAQDMDLFITDAPAFVLTHNIHNGFLIGGSIVMTFNKAVVPASFHAYLNIDKSAKTEIASVTWTNNNTTVTIVPDENLRIGMWYYFWFEGRSVDGNEFGDDYYFETQPGIDIKTTNLDYYDGYYSITQEQNIVIVFTEAVISSPSNQLIIRSWDIYGNYVGDISASVQTTWSADKKTLTIVPPSTPGYQKGQIRLEFVYLSNLGQDDGVYFNNIVQIR
jgi:hypothetical protein